MQITAIDTFPLAYPEPNDNNNIRYTLLVRVTTDVGLVGWGEAVTMWPEASLATVQLIHNGFAPLLLGRDPRDSTTIWQAMRAQSWWYGDGGIASFAISGLDIAMWDLKGKALNVPVYQLLGGKLRDKLRVCASIHPAKASLDELAQELVSYVAQGYSAIKVGFGKRGDARLGVDPERDIAYVQAMRAALGKHVDLMVDLGANVRWEATQAIRTVQAFERIGIRWMEDPLRKWDWEGYARLRDVLQTQICTGEELWTVEEYRRLIKAGFADIIIVDPGRAEGITGYWQVQEMTIREQRYINAHAWSSAIVTSASMHLTAVAPNYIVFEVKPQRNPLQHDLVREPLEPTQGQLTIPARPGLGIEINEAIVQQYLD